MQTHRARLVVSFLILASASSVFSQVKVPTVQGVSKARLSEAQHPQQEPCWKQVGISQAAMDEEKSIRREARAQIEAVCQDASLSEQQKQAKIHEIRQAEHERLDSLIPAEKREELKQCQQARAGSHPATPHPSGVQTGPCGEIAGR